MDLKYAYYNLILDPEAAQHCHFNRVTGESTVAYKIITAFNCIENKPVAFLEKDHTLIVLKNTYCLIHDIIIVVCLTKIDRLTFVYKCLNKLNKENLQIKLSNRHFSRKNDRVNYRLTQNGISRFEF